VPGSFTRTGRPLWHNNPAQRIVARRRPVVWLPLDQGTTTCPLDAPPGCQRSKRGQAARFVRRLSCCGRYGPTILINDLITQGRPVVLVLDDYHEIQNPSIHAGLLFLLEHLPHNLHLLLSTRTDPPWPLARFRARSRLVEIRAQDLRFSIAETKEFLNRTMMLICPR
jgi:hypothetical protein